MKWNVTLPVAGWAELSNIEAESEEAAIKAAAELFDNECIAELAPYPEGLLQGNVCNAEVTEASADPVDEEEEDGE